VSGVLASWVPSAGFALKDLKRYQYGSKSIVLEMTEPAPFDALTPPATTASAKVSRVTNRVTGHDQATRSAGGSCSPGCSRSSTTGAKRDWSQLRCDFEKALREGHEFTLARIGRREIGMTHLLHLWWNRRLAVGQGCGRTSRQVAWVHRECARVRIRLPARLV